MKAGPENMARAGAGMLAVIMLASACDPARETYRRHNDTLRASGMLRTERAPADASFSNSVLAENFERIAFNREYRRIDDQLVAKTTPARLSRWEQPIRYRLGGDAATWADRSEYAGFIEKLTGLTGVQFAEAGEDDEPNLTILILGPEGRRQFKAELEAEGLARNMPLVIRWADDVDHTCVGQVAFDDLDTGLITGAMIVIKGELEGVLRSSCIHEELTQTLGLMNDDPDVRPSIFNDDQEFALLTEHDEYLFRILHDPRLRNGMNKDEAMPIVRRIIAELRPGK